MTAAEIIAELPKLTRDERQEIAGKLKELDGTDDLLFLHEAADLMFQDIDRREEEDARGKAR